MQFEWRTHMRKTCLYLKPSKNQSFLDIQREIDIISERFESQYEIVKTLVETDEFSQLDIFLNREIDKFDYLILCKPINDEFYGIILQELSKQRQLKIIQVE